MPEGTSKICIVCGQDCSGKPRTKDLNGNYTCRDCLDSGRAAKKARPAPVAAAPAVSEPNVFDTGDDDAALMAALIDDGPAGPGHAHACPNCGAALPAESVVCAGCGYNKITGRTTPKAERSRGSGAAAGAGALAASAAGVLASGSSILLTTLIGAAIGGAVGAAIWAAICYNTGFEIGWIAWGVGGLTGAGAAIGARGHAGVATGGIAVLVAICAILAGKYITVSMWLGDGPSLSGLQIEVEEEEAIAIVARAVAAEHTARGRNYKWPEDGTPEYSYYEDDFPKPIWTDAKARWDRLSAEERIPYYEVAERETRDMQEAFASAIREVAFLSMFSLFDLLFFALAIITAAGVGSGGAIAIGGGDDD
jgi:hypothetical protein